MPRLSQTQQEKKNQALMNRLDAYIMQRYRAGDNSETVARALGLTKSTMYNRLAKPSTFTLQELYFIANVLNVNVGTLLGERGETI